MEELKLDKRQKILTPFVIRNIRMEIEHRFFKLMEKTMRRLDHQLPKYDMQKAYLKQKFTEFLYDFKPSEEKLAKIDQRSNRGKMIYLLWIYPNERIPHTPFLELYPVGISYCIRRIEHRQENIGVTMECNMVEWFLAVNQKSRYVFVYGNYTKWETDSKLIVRKNKQPIPHPKSDLLKYTYDLIRNG